MGIGSTGGDTTGQGSQAGTSTGASRGLQQREGQAVGRTAPGGRGARALPAPAPPAAHPCTWAPWACSGPHRRSNHLGTARGGDRCRCGCSEGRSGTETQVSAGTRRRRRRRHSSPTPNPPTISPAAQHPPDSDPSCNETAGNRWRSGRGWCREAAEGWGVGVIDQGVPPSVNAPSHAPIARLVALLCGLGIAGGHGQQQEAEEEGARHGVGWGWFSLGVACPVACVLGEIRNGSIGSVWIDRTSERLVWHAGGGLRGKLTGHLCAGRKPEGLK